MLNKDLELTKGHSEEHIEYKDAKENFLKNHLWRKVRSLLQLTEIDMSPLRVAKLPNIESGLSLEILEGLVILGQATRTHKGYVCREDAPLFYPTEDFSLEKAHHVVISHQIQSMFMKSSTTAYTNGDLWAKPEEVWDLFKEFLDRIESIKRRNLKPRTGVHKLFTYSSTFLNSFDPAEATKGTAE